MRTILPKSFFNLDTLTIAQKLLGTYLVHDTLAGQLVGRIVETEAYLHDDPAAHTYIGKTNRNRVMFGPAGHAYIYFIYGMYHCVNCSTNIDGIGEGVLIRALEPVSGIERMKKNRNVNKLKDLCSGPGKLTKAMDITHEQYGLCLIDKLSALRLEVGIDQPNIPIVTTTRVGLSKAKEALYRFYIEGNAHVSRR